MAKIKINKTYSNGTVYKEHNHIYIDEIEKEVVKTYDLTSLLEDLVGSENVSITVSVKDDIIEDDPNNINENDAEEDE